MAAMNSLLFLLTTLAPFIEKPEDTTAPYDASFEWHRGLKPAAEAAFDDSTTHCEPDERYTPCHALCQKNCSNYDQPIPCSTFCVSGCVCRPPKIRGPNGACITVEQCPRSSEGSTDSSDDDEYITTPYITDHQNKARDISDDEEYITETAVTSEDEEITEAPHEYQGPLKQFFNCPDNQYWSVSGTLACPDSCENYKNKNRVCRFVRVPFPQCVCKPEFVRGPGGDCIKAEQCPSHETQFINCTENEYWSNLGTVACPDNCENFRNKNRACRFVPVPFPQCVCNPEFLRGPGGDCIKADQCPNHESDEKKVVTSEDEEITEAPNKYQGPQKQFFNCPDNEYWSIRGTLACPDSCENYKNRNRACRFVRVPFPQCVCKPEFVRGPDGDCIKEEQCPSQETQFFNCTENEYWSNSGNVACPDNCENFRNKNRACRFVQIPFPQCVCNSEFLRGPSGDCIKADQCPNHEKNTVTSEDEEIAEAPYKHQGLQKQFFNCPDNEYWSFQGTLACPDSCENYKNRNRVCRFVRVPFPQCVCKPEFVRGPNGDCIKAEQCPSHGKQFFNCPDNEYWSILGTHACPDSCENYKNRNRICKFVRVPFPQCVCKPEFVRGPGGDCIKPEQCPTNEKRPENCTEFEFYDKCGSENSCPINEQQEKMFNKTCVAGCFCLAGLLRGPQGNCITPADCLIQPTTPHVEPKENQTHKIPENCTEFEFYDKCGSENSCPINEQQERMFNKTCVAGCFCLAGLLRGPQGNCITSADCLIQPTTPHVEPKENQTHKIPENCTELEFYDNCGSENSCYINDQQDSVFNKTCVAGCFCLPDLIRGPQGNCITQADCLIQPTTPHVEPKENQTHNLQGGRWSKILPNFCNTNEELVLWSSFCPDTCENYQNPKRPCNLAKKPTPSCQCKEGYVRDRSGICIKKEQCIEALPENCTDLEYYDHCGSYCEADCANQNYRNMTCKDIGCKAGCFCKPIYVRGTNWECVMPYDCPPQPQTP